MFDVELSDDLRPGDRVYIHTAGAYTTCYASTFNGFDLPRTYCIGEQHAELIGRPLSLSRRRR